MLKKIILLECLFLGSLFLAFPAGAQENIKIGISFATTYIDHWGIDREAMIGKAKEMGIEVVEKNANEDTSLQIKHIKELISGGVKAIIIIPNDKEKLIDVVKEAKKKGIKVISYDRLIKSAGVDLYISYDGIRIGEMMAKELIKRVSDGNIVIFDGAPTDNNSILYNTGIKKVLKNALETNKINVIREYWTPNWREKEAYRIMDEILMGGTKIDGVIAANDRLAEAVIMALTEHRLAGDIPVIGNDAELSACQRIMEGTQTATIFRSYEKLAEIAVESAYNLIKDKKINMISKTSDGTNIIDAVLLSDKISVVTRENMEDIIVKGKIYSQYEVNLYNPIAR